MRLLTELGHLLGEFAQKCRTSGATSDNVSIPKSRHVILSSFFFFLCASLALRLGG
jgi:hypothetical protein